MKTILMGKMRKGSAISAAWCALPAVNSSRQYGRLEGKDITKRSSSSTKVLGQRGTHTEQRELNLVSAPRGHVILLR